MTIAQIKHLIYVNIDRRIKVFINEREKGPSGARNTALKKAIGKYIMFVDDDDFVEKNYVNEMVNRIQYNNLAICAYYLVKEKNKAKIHLPLESGVYRIEDIFTPLFFGTLNNRGTLATSLWTGIFKHTIISENQILFDENIRFSEDWMFYAEYFSKIKGTIHLINDPLYNYRINIHSLTKAYRAPSKLGVEKGVYILKSFQDIMEKNSIETSLYKTYLQKRYLDSIILCNFGLFHPENKMTFSEKKEFLKYRIYGVEENNYISKAVCSLRSRVKLEYYLYRCKNIYLLILYAKVYYFLKQIKRG